MKVTMLVLWRSSIMRSVGAAIRELAFSVATMVLSPVVGVFSAGFNMLISLRGSLVDLFRPHLRRQVVKSREDKIVFHLDLGEIEVALIMARLGTMAEIAQGVGLYRLRVDAVLRFVRVVLRVLKEVHRRVERVVELEPSPREDEVISI